MLRMFISLFQRFRNIKTHILNDFIIQFMEQELIDGLYHKKRQTQNDVVISSGSRSFIDVILFSFTHSIEKEIVREE